MESKPWSHLHHDDENITNEQHSEVVKETLPRPTTINVLRDDLIVGFPSLHRRSSSGTESSTNISITSHSTLRRRLSNKSSNASKDQRPSIALSSLSTIQSNKSPNTSLRRRRSTETRHSLSNSLARQGHLQPRCPSHEHSQQSAQSIRMRLSASSLRSSTYSEDSVTRQNSLPPMKGVDSVKSGEIKRRPNVERRLSSDSLIRRLSLVKQHNATAHVPLLAGRDKRANDLSDSHLVDLQWLRRKNISSTGIGLRLSAFSNNESSPDCSCPSTLSQRPSMKSNYLQGSNTELCEEFVTRAVQGGVIIDKLLDDEDNNMLVMEEEFDSKKPWRKGPPAGVISVEDNKRQLHRLDSGFVSLLESDAIVCRDIKKPVDDTATDKNEEETVSSNLSKADKMAVCLSLEDDENSELTELRQANEVLFVTKSAPLDDSSVKHQSIVVVSQVSDALTEEEDKMMIKQDNSLPDIVRKQSGTNVGLYPVQEKSGDADTLNDSQRNHILDNLPSLTKRDSFKKKNDDETTSATFSDIDAGDIASSIQSCMTVFDTKLENKHIFDVEFGETKPLNLSKSGEEEALTLLLEDIPAPDSVNGSVSNNARGGDCRSSRRLSGSYIKKSLARQVSKFESKSTKNYRQKNKWLWKFCVWNWRKISICVAVTLSLLVVIAMLATQAFDAEESMAQKVESELGENAAPTGSWSEQWPPLESGRNPSRKDAKPSQLPSMFPSLSDDDSGGEIVILSTTLVYSYSPSSMPSTQLDLSESPSVPVSSSTPPTSLHESLFEPPISTTSTLPSFSPSTLDTFSSTTSISSEVLQAVLINTTTTTVTIMSFLTLSDITVPEDPTEKKNLVDSIEKRITTVVSSSLSDDDILQKVNILLIGGLTITAFSRQRVRMHHPHESRRSLQNTTDVELEVIVANMCTGECTVNSEAIGASVSSDVSSCLSNHLLVQTALRESKNAILQGVTVGDITLDTNVEVTSQVETLTPNETVVDSTDVNPTASATMQPSIQSTTAVPSFYPSTRTSSAPPSLSGGGSPIINLLKLS